MVQQIEGSTATKHEGSSRHALALPAQRAPCGARTPESAPRRRRPTGTARPGSGRDTPPPRRDTRGREPARHPSGRDRPPSRRRPYVPARTPATPPHRRGRRRRATRRATGPEVRSGTHAAARRATRKPERKPVPSAASASLATYCRPSIRTSHTVEFQPPWSGSTDRGPRSHRARTRSKSGASTTADAARSPTTAKRAGGRTALAQARQPSGPAREERDLHPTGSRPGHQRTLDWGCDLGGATHRSRDSRPAAWADVRQLLYRGQMAMASPWCSGSIGSVGSTCSDGAAAKCCPPRRVADQT